MKNQINTIKKGDKFIIVASSLVERKEYLSRNYREALIEIIEMHDFVAICKMKTANGEGIFSISLEAKIYTKIDAPKNLKKYFDKDGNVL